MRVWYSDVFIHQPKELRAQKLGECGHPAKFLSYPETLSGYRTYNPTNHKVSIVHVPSFHEEAQPHPDTTFETPADDSDDDTTSREVSEPLPMNDSPHDALEALDTSHVPPPTAPGCLACARHAPTCYDPTDFGAHGCRKKAMP